MSLKWTIDGLAPKRSLSGSWLKSVNAPPKESTPFLRTFAITVPASGAMILYQAGITVSKAKCFPSVDKYNRTPATRNPAPIGK